MTERVNIAKRVGKPSHLGRTLPSLLYAATASHPNAQTGLPMSDIGRVELNEAFASQSLAVVRALGMDIDRVNVHGGAIALGHPLGATGAKLTATLLHEMQREGIRYGLCTMCIGGGMGAAGVFENLVL